ncbi:protein of unknown function [Pseudodesulfovibrio piezophilus C1TLV30]|uniref:Uncharacterized protein n=1 Tax=Pseudodesulfovibrio piezophilus (strain DSM 21447 / JCM 15486 / C1TLV30) TaxID=1322246 RepID=M1WKF1_PSEP2|nr:protein of unknown function [Pseudodesulfovibrio piezophilus C1TLV30]
MGRTSHSFELKELISAPDPLLHGDTVPLIGALFGVVKEHGYDGPAQSVHRSRSCLRGSSAACHPW